MLQLTNFNSCSESENEEGKTTEQKLGMVAFVWRLIHAHRRSTFPQTTRNSSSAVGWNSEAACNTVRIQAHA
jgi:hypothetical protein